jgi:hypothetical protein
MSDTIVVFDSEIDGSFIRIVGKPYTSETLASDREIDAKIDYLKKDLEEERKRAKRLLKKARAVSPF